MGLPGCASLTSRGRENSKRWRNVKRHGGASCRPAPIALHPATGYTSAPPAEIKGIMTNSPAEAPVNLRDRLGAAVKEAMKAKDALRVSTLRMVTAAIKDRDIAARTRGDGSPITADEILQLLQTMVRQRRESAGLYEKGGRPELAQQEMEEIAIIEGFLPKQMSESEARAAIAQTIAELGAAGVKDMGRVMARVKEQFAGQMDFARAAGIAKSLLG